MALKWLANAVLVIFSIAVTSLAAEGVIRVLDGSPLFAADRIRIPLLVGQGANDPRVKQAESEQIVGAIERNRGNAIYVLYPDEGHGFARPPNRMDFNARAEQFLAEHLGGRAERMEGDRLPGSTAVVRIIGGGPAASTAGVGR